MGGKSCAQSVRFLNGYLPIAGFLQNSKNCMILNVNNFHHQKVRNLRLNAIEILPNKKNEENQNFPREKLIS